MSKNAVFTLLFLLGTAIVAEPIISPPLAQGDVSPQFGSAELLAKNHIKLKNFSAYGVPQTHESIQTLITAYSSSIDETDSTPFITASGSYARDGIVAANFLPIGAQIMMPELFGGQIFTVEDRLNKNYNDRIDVWFPSKKQAIQFGQKISRVEILQLQ